MNSVIHGLRIADDTTGHVCFKRFCNLEVPLYITLHTFNHMVSLKNTITLSINKEMKESGELDSLLPKATSLDDRYVHVPVEYSLLGCDAM